MQERQQNMSEDNTNKDITEPVMLDEYDFSNGVRGKYFKDAHMSSNIVALEPDVAERFPNSSAVNQALRTLMSIQDKKNEE